MALTRETGEHLTEENVTGNIKPQHWPEPLLGWLLRQAPSLQGSARGEAWAACEQGECGAAQEARVGRASRAPPAGKLGSGHHLAQGEGARDYSPAQPLARPGHQACTGNCVTLSIFHAKSCAQPASLTTVGTGVSKEKQEAGELQEEEQGCRSSVPLMECGPHDSKPGQEGTSQVRAVCSNHSASWQAWGSLIPSHKVTRGQGTSTALGDKWGSRLRAISLICF